MYFVYNINFKQLKKIYYSTLQHNSSAYQPLNVKHVLLFNEVFLSSPILDYERWAQS